MNNIESILTLASDTKALEIGCGKLASAPEMFKKLFPGKRPVIVADEITFKLAGEKLSAYFSVAGIDPAEPIVFSASDFHAEWRFVEYLDKALADVDAIAVAVGSGTINDLTKLSSYHNGRRYMTVATAASMDGYTAFGASITKDGAKQTFSCPAPLGFVADMDIIATAPAEMTASGYADLFAKIPAGADWILADALGVEAIDECAFRVVQDGLKSALDSPERLRSGDIDAVSRLTEGLLMGGFAMQIHKSSRPASGADHQISHLWNMEHHRMEDGTMPSHGFQVSIGTLLSTALYEKLLDEDFSTLDVDSCVAKWPSLEKLKAESEEMFRNTDFPTIGVIEDSAKYVDADGLRAQLTVLRDNWLEIKGRIKAQIIPFDEVRRSLSIVGAPVDPEEIGITRSRLYQSAVRAQHIRRRFTILDLAVRTGKLNEWLDSVFKSEFAV